MEVNGQLHALPTLPQRRVGNWSELYHC